ncbi:hypothetical protein GmHk_08G021529 [Glycine max]|nr:hypothetical protein GmHk_08G021529 [Glycine max]
MSDPSHTPDKLEDALLRLTQQQSSMTAKIDELLMRLPPLLHHNPSPTSSSPPSPSPASVHKMKLDVPRYQQS